MSDLLKLAFSAFLLENVLLIRFLGICPFLGVSQKRSSAIGMGFAVIFVIVMSSIVTWLIHMYVLAPYGLEYLQTIVFILVIAALVQIVEMFVKKFSMSLYKALGIYLPLITTNCAVLGVAIININQELSFLEMLVFSFFSSAGFLFVMVIFSSLREKMANSPIPKPFKGIPIALIVAAAMAMIFSRLGGII
jgi:electron transport complex protein RnfA